MLIRIFEIKNKTFMEQPDDLDERVMKLLQQYGDDINVTKVNVLDREAMEKFDDVKAVLKDKGLDCLPIITVEGDMIDESELEDIIKDRAK